jgi:uncharacterized membrane protein
MTDTARLFPLWVEIAGYLGSGLCLLFAFWPRPLDYLSGLRQPCYQHLLLGATVAVSLLWVFRAGISPGLAIHFLGVTSLTLLLGWRLALLSLVFVCIGMGMTGREAWPSLGVLYLLTAAAPVAVNWALYRWVERQLPKHLFIYLFVVVFAGAALASITVTVGISLLMMGLDIYSLDRLAYEYLSFIPLVALPEALLNGFVMTGLVILRPSWVATYDVEVYLRR